MHTCRGDIHEDGLADDCDGCLRLAEDPFSNMDHTMLSNLIARNFYYRYGDERFRREWEPRSNNETAAMVAITNAMEKMGKLFETDADLMVEYLRKRWRIPFVGLPT